MTFTIINIVLISVILYSLVLYPILLVILSFFFKNTPATDKDFKPAITFIIAAYNEQNYISDALQSILDLDYDLNKIQVIIGSDGSTDRTIEISNSYKDKFKDLTILDLKRGGKNNVLNESYKHIKNDYIYILDADFRLKPNSINESIKYFTDPNIGAVISKLNIISGAKPTNAGEIGESTYQKFDNFIKVKESEIWSTLNNFGCYGIRKELLYPIPNNKVCDDMYNILRVASEKRRVFITNESIVNEVREKYTAEEIKRRERISSGSISTLLAVPQILNPKLGWSSFFFFSHRFIRFFYPIILILVLVFTPFMYCENTTIFYIFAIGQIIFYLFSFIGYLLDKKNIVLPLFSFPYFFLMLNIGYFNGIIQFIKNEQSAVWERADTQQNSNI